MTDGLTREQAREALRAQLLARTTLTGYARYIDIPGVPEAAEVDDRQYRVVETPLGLHHTVMLNAMQLMAQGLLVYRRTTLDSPVDWALLRGEEPGPETPPPGSCRRGGSNFKAAAPSPDFKKTGSYPAPPLLSTSDEKQGHTFAGGVKSAGNHGEIPEFYQRYRDINVVLRGVLSGRMPETDARQLIHGIDSGLQVCRRVMLMLPPGSAKSTYASVVFPTWAMGHVKAFEVILTGWGDPICKRHGKRARQICTSPQYKALFGTEVDPNTRAAEDWMLRNNSSYKSSGITAGISGFRAHGLIWDDLVKNRKDAESVTIRNDIWNEYIDSARSRKTPDAWEVGIGTRWHEDEHMGRILPEGYNGESGFMECRDGNVWFVICMAAECERDDDPLGREQGEMIWQEWFTEDYWAEKRQNPRSWASLYQQRPAPAEGLVYQRENFRTYRNLPQNLDYYLAYDPGVSDQGDETAMQVWGVDDKARLYLVDRFYRKCSMDVWIVQLIQWVRQYKPIEAISEAGVIRRAAEPWIQRAMRQEKVFFTQSWVTRSANKEAMSAPAIAMVNSGQVFVPETSVGTDFVDMCLRFPASKEDHDPDAFANLCLRLETIWETTPVRKIEEKSVMIGSFAGEPMKVKQFMPERFPKHRSRWSR